MHFDLRMIDANANRAREGLRVLEDAARFRLGDADLCGQIKAIRHDLRNALDALGCETLLLAAHRDTPGDVGTTIKTESEARRATLAEVASASAKRAAEALRVLEELAKTVSPLSPRRSDINLRPLPVWREFELLRYRLYDAERRVILALGTQRASQWRLCVLITESQCARPWLEVAAAALDAGADALQLREKSLTDAELLMRAERLMSLASCQRGPAARPVVIINDRADIALLAGADGVHLGQEDLPTEAVRRLAGQRLLIGASTHDMTEAERALESGADYCGVGAAFASTTKPRPVSGLEYIRAFTHDQRFRNIPHLAIGGIRPDNIDRLVEAGARGVAVSSCVCSASDPGAMVRRLLAALPSSPSVPWDVQASNGSSARSM